MRHWKEACGLALSLTMAMVVYPVSVHAAGRYSDVPADAWYEEAVTYCTETGLMNGTGEGKFSPDAGMSRAMLATVLYRQAGNPKGEFEATIPDVPEDTWYTDSAKWAVSTGIFTGDESGNFLPQSPAQRQELALLLYRCAKSEGLDLSAKDHVDLSIYPDGGEVAEWAVDGMCWAVASGILLLDEGLLNSTQSNSRAQLASAFMNYEKLKHPGLSGTQNVVVEGFDWGPAVTKTILSLNQPVAPDSVRAEFFRVTECKESFDFATMAPDHITVEAERVVTAAYVCDAKGNQTESASPYIALELAYSPSDGSPYCYDIFEGKNTVCNPYELSISLAGSAALTTEGGDKIAQLTVNQTVDLSKADMPQLARVDLSGTFVGTDGKVLTYGSYAPAEDGNQHPLVIWIHGAGEGGTDASIPLLGNKVTALYGEEFQKIMGGAYVLTPQTPTFWLQYNEEGDWQDNPGVDSVYLSTLMELIEDYVSKHSGIDQTRIYVGGCSNGGYMTMNLILSHPKYFAAAFPICEAYRDAGITDVQIEAIKDLPVWFVYAEDDDIVDPTNFEIPTIERLKKAEANVHTSIFPNVVDMTGNYKGEDGAPYAYSGHWSWLYFFNNQCEENGVSLWNWLAQQRTK